MRTLIGPAWLVVAALVATCSCARPKAATDPIGVSSVSAAAIPKRALPSWNEGPAKQAILDFVARVSSPGPTMVPEAERIAVVGSDGTLWPESPPAEVAFVVARLKGRVLEDPKLREEEPYRSVMNNDVDGLVSLGREALLSSIASTHAGMTEEAFDQQVRSFFASSRHPRFNVPYTDLAYRPMRDLLDYLRDHGFTVYLCTEGEEGFVRAFAPQTFRIPREHIIGSSLRRQIGFENGQTTLRRQTEVASLNDRDEKVVNIARTIGHHPLLAIGRVRSGGDVAMLTYSRRPKGTSLALVINHDDAEREFAYREADGATLTAAAAHGFVVVSMKKDWARVFDLPERALTFEQRVSDDR